MAKGFFRGALWGSAISFCAVTVVSILGDGPLVHIVQANASDPGTTPRALTSASDGGSSQQPSVAQLSGPKAPKRDTLSAMHSSDTAPAAQPLVGTVGVLDATSEIENFGEGGAFAPRAQERQIQSAGQTQSLTSPLIETALSISTEPAQPPIPTVIEETGLYAEPEKEPAPEVQTDIAVLAAPKTQTVVQEKPVAQETPVAADDPVQPQVPAQTEQASGFGNIAVGDATPSVAPREADTSFDVAAVIPEQTLQVPVPNRSASEPVGIPAEPKPEQTASAATAPARTSARVSTATNVLAVPEEAAEAPILELETGTAPDIGITQDVTPEPVETQTAPQPEIIAQAEPEEIVPAPSVPVVPRVIVQAPQSTAGEAVTADGPAIGKRVGVLGDRADGVQTNRLPSLTEDRPEDAPVLDAVAQLPSPETADQSKPLVRFAEPVANPDNKPVMAIVLMDQGGALDGDAIGLPALRSFPYPVSFAIDAFAPDAAERMAAYRAEGFEVLAMVNLPKGAQARDAEVSMAVALAALPEAVGVLEGLDEGVQTTRDAAAQVTEILAQSGHGFVTQNKGLNTVQKLAAKAGVPSAVVFRDFDDQGQTPSVIRRFLDQAAFRAGQEGGVIMLGRLREDTIAALLVWALQDRAEQVALTPVSAVLAIQP